MVKRKTATTSSCSASAAIVRPWPAPLSFSASCSTLSFFLRCCRSWQWMLSLVPFSPLLAHPLTSSRPTLLPTSLAWGHPSRRSWGSCRCLRSQSKTSIISWMIKCVDANVMLTLVSSALLLVHLGHLRSLVRRPLPLSTSLLLILDLCRRKPASGQYHPTAPSLAVLLTLLCLLAQLWVSGLAFGGWHDDLDKKSKERREVRASKDPLCRQPPLAH